MNERSVRAGSFADEILPHLDSAYNLARWLVRNTDDADDIVQEAYLKAFRHFATFQGGDARAWLLRIVRNTAYRWFHKNRAQQGATEFDEAIHGVVRDPDPEALMLQDADSQLVEQAINTLPARFREVLVLREFEGLSYKEISEVTDVPIGTVMSSLSRARHKFRQAVHDGLSKTLAVAGPPRR